MATKTIHPKTTRQQKAGVGFGQILINSDISLGDTININLPSKGLIYAKVTTDGTSPPTAKLFNANSDSVNDITVPSDATVINYVATYAKGAGNPLKIRALPNVPVLSSLSSSPLAATTATLNITVNTKGAATTYHFDYGIAAYSEHSTTPVTLAYGAGGVKTAAITGLTAATTYMYRAVASNAGGSATAATGTFTTTA